MMNKGVKVIMTASMFCLFGCQAQETEVPSLRNDKIVLEYGERMDLNKKYILDTEDTSIIQSIKLDTSAIDMEEDGNYPQIGEYLVPVTFQVNGESYEEALDVEIEDTTGPLFTRYAKVIDLNQNADTHDFTEDFEASDLSEVNVYFQTYEIQFDTPGQYEAEAVAEDVNGNTTRKTFKVVIHENPVSSYYDNASTYFETPEYLFDDTPLIDISDQDALLPKEPNKQSEHTSLRKLVMNVRDYEGKTETVTGMTPDTIDQTDENGSPILVYRYNGKTITVKGAVPPEDSTFTASVRVEKQEDGNYIIWFDHYTMN